MHHRQKLFRLAARHFTTNKALHHHVTRACDSGEDRPDVALAVEKSVITSNELCCRAHHEGKGGEAEEGIVDDGGAHE